MFHLRGQAMRSGYAVSEGLAITAYQYRRIRTPRSTPLMTKTDAPGEDIYHRKTVDRIDNDVG
jgi:hypothetical protein